MLLFIVRNPVNRNIFQTTSRFDFSKFADFAIHLDIMFIKCIVNTPTLAFVIATVLASDF